jgi:chorismate synthase
MSSSFGTLFRMTTFGESHGPAVGVVVDGCPPAVAVDRDKIQAQLDRRRPGQSRLTTARRETDQVAIVSGVQNGLSLGTPIAMTVANADGRPSDYHELGDVPRPSHADFTYRCKYGVAAASGGGRASARETVGRVAAGAVAEALLEQAFGTQIVAWVSAVGPVTAPVPAVESLTRDAVDQNPVRCPHPASAAAMAEAIVKIREAGDSIGGIVSCVCRGIPPGWGEPVFDKCDALLAQAMLSIPAAKGFDIGAGFGAAIITGSTHNDPFVWKGDRLGTVTNFSGGVQGGITNGEFIWFRVAFKPTATIAKAQNSADYNGHPVVVRGRGRHDPCVAPRAVPIVEAMAALVLADLALRQQARRLRISN